MKTHLKARALSGPEVQRMSSAFALACALLAAALPMAVLYHLMTLSTEQFLVRAGVNLSSFRGVLPEVSSLQRLAVVLLGMLPVCCTSYGLICAMRCFSGFSQAEYFSVRTVRYLRGFAAGIFASVVAGVLVSALISVLLTAQAPAGQRSLSLGLSSHELLTLVFAGMVWQISAVMAKAVALAEENAQFI